MNVPTSSGKPGPLADLDNRRDVADRRARRAVGAHLQLGVDDLAGQALDIGDDVRAGAGQADVGGVDAEPIDEVQDLDLLLDRRRPHRRRLQPVAQRLVVEHHARRLGRRADLVPVVDQGFEHLTDLGRSLNARVLTSMWRDEQPVSPPRRQPRSPRATAPIARAAARTIGRKPSLMVSAGSPCWCRTSCDRTNAWPATRVCQSNVTLNTTTASRSQSPSPTARSAGTSAPSFRSGVLHDQRRHVVVLLGAVRELLDGVDDLLEHDLGAARGGSAPSPATRRSSPNSSPATLCASVTPSL